MCCIFFTPLIKSPVRIIKIDVVFQKQRQNSFTVQQLVDELIGPYYANYSETRSVLVGQAEQLLATVYGADLIAFHSKFCVPAQRILDQVAKNQVFTLL